MIILETREGFKKVINEHPRVVGPVYYVYRPAPMSVVATENILNTRQGEKLEFHLYEELSDGVFLYRER
jgi:hypothetical protein